MTEIENAPYDLPKERVNPLAQIRPVGVHGIDPDLERITITLNHGIDRLDLCMCEAVRDLNAPQSEKRAIQRQIIDPVTDFLLDLHDDYTKAAKVAIDLSETVCRFESPSQNPNLNAFLHDFRNLFCALHLRLELHLEDDNQVSINDLTEAEDAMRCFMDQRPQDILQMRSCAKRISALKLTFLSSKEMELLPCTPTDLLQVINNASFNAKQAKATEIVVSCIPQNGEIVLQISDNGPGFTTECIETITAASRANNPLKGNGLRIIEHIVKKHGGEFNISNLAENRGACLKIRFPQH